MMKFHRSITLAVVKASLCLVAFGVGSTTLRSQVRELQPPKKNDPTPSVAKPASPKADSGVPIYEPLAPKFWLKPGDADANPPELPLWPDGLPEVRDVKQTVESRDDDRLNRWVSGVREPTISIHRAKHATSAVVVCPGGGYAGQAFDKEGHDTARWLNSMGVTAAVLKYRCREYGQPAPGKDAQRAIAAIRARADELGIERNRVGVMGYSAGGHVASTAGTRFRAIEFNGQKVSSRPDFMILVYPVISMDAAITHGGSRAGLLGDNPSDELVQAYSNDVQVTGKTPPTFLVHAADDLAVPLENSLRMMRALEAAGVPVELALYEHGGHGFGLVSEPIPAAQWPRRCEQWLRDQGFLSDSNESLSFRMPEYAEGQPPPPREKSEVEKLLAGAAKDDNPQPLNVLLVAGPKDHGVGEHDYPNWQKVWSRLLAVHEHTTVDTAWEFPEQAQIDAADVIVFYQRGRWDNARAAAMDPFLARGGGAVYIHWAVDGRGGEHEMAKRIGLASLGGAIGFRHGPLQVDFSHNPDHPIARNLTRVDWVDESYWRLRGDPSRITLLGTGVEEGEPRPLFWTMEQGPGRVFVSIPGHYMWTFDDPFFRAVLLRGIAWTGRRNVDRFNDLVRLDARIE